MKVEDVRFGDEVVIVGGFWEGCEGRVVDIGGLRSGRPAAFDVMLKDGKTYATPVFPEDMLLAPK